MTPQELSGLTEKALDELVLETGRTLRDQYKILANHIVEGASQAKACRDAGYSERGSKQQASRVMARKDVRTYVDLLREQIRRTAGINRGWMIRQHLEAAQSAKADKDWSGFKACMQEAGKLLDFYPSLKTETKLEHSGEVGINTNYQHEDVLRELMDIRRSESGDTAVH
tara:strand:- start:81 stop:590 length:510 start_codon:yes stop_codon:yes gene_type:complete